MGLDDKGFWSDKENGLSSLCGMYEPERKVFGESSTAQGTHLSFLFFCLFNGRVSRTSRGSGKEMKESK